MFFKYITITHNMAPTDPNKFSNWDNPELMQNISEFDKDWPYSFDLSELLGIGSMTEEDMMLFQVQLDFMRDLFQWDQNNADEEYLQTYYDNFYDVESMYLSTVGFKPDDWQPRRWFSNFNPGRKDRNTKFHPTTNKTPTKAKLSVKRYLKKRDVKGQRCKFKKDCARDQQEYIDQYNCCDCNMCGPGPLLCHSCRNDTLMMVEQEMRDRYSHIEFHFSIWDGLETEKDILDRMFQMVWLTDVLVDITTKSESVQVSFHNDGQDDLDQFLEDRDEEVQDEFQKENWHLKCGRKDSHTKLTRKDRKVRRKNGYRGMTHAGRRRNARKLASSI